MCHSKFPQMICKPLAAKLLSSDVIALFEFEDTENGVSIVSEKHYRLVNPEELSQDELLTYRNRPI